MARLRTQHTFLLSKDSTETNKIFERVQRDEELTDAFVNGSSVATSLAPTVAYGVNLQGITPVRFVYVESDKEVLVTLNGTDAVRVLPRAASSPQQSVVLPGRFYVWTDSVTSLVVSNPSSTNTAKVTVVFAGG